MAEVPGERQVLRNLAAFLREFPQKAEKAMFLVAQVIVSRAKIDHPYQDRTGNLTNSLQGDAEAVSADLVRAVVFASMEYAPFVETIKGGKYAYLLPALLSERDTILDILQRELAL